MIWLQIFFFSLTRIHGLRLHSGKITPLQLAIQLGENFDTTGIVLMASIDVSKSFQDFVHLLNIKTLRFRKCFQQTCSTRFSLELMARLGVQAATNGHCLSRLMGLDCVGEIPHFGQIFPLLDVSGLPINGPLKMINFSGKQIQIIIDGLTDPNSGNELLTTGFLNFGPPDVEHVDQILKESSRVLVDGPFCKTNLGACLLMIPELSHLNIVEMLEAKQLSSTNLLALKVQIKPWIPVDIIARFMQLAATLMFESWSHRRRGDKWPTIQILRHTTIQLVRKIIENINLFHLWILEIRLALEVVKAILTLDVEAAQFKALILETGYSCEIDYYAMILKMIESLMKTEGSIPENMVEIVLRLKVESLSVLAQFTSQAKCVHQHVKELLAPSLYNDRLRVPRCRHLVVLLWSLAQEPTIYGKTCHLLMAHILKVIPPDTDLSVLADFKLIPYLPWRLKKDLLRLNLNWQIETEGTAAMYSSQYVQICALGAYQGESCSIRGGRKDPNGYLDLKENRRSVSKLIKFILRHNFVYCGHNNGLPVYIQSLACHPFVNELFLQLLKHASALRLSMPFTLHPQMLALMRFPHGHEEATKYLAAAFKHEFSDNADPMDSERILRKVDHILALVDQIISLDQVKQNRRYGWKEEGTIDELYDDWMDRLFKERLENRRSPAGKMRTLSTAIKLYGVRLVKFSVTDLVFSDLYQCEISQKEGLSIMLNQPKIL